MDVIEDLLDRLEKFINSQPTPSGIDRYTTNCQVNTLKYEIHNILHQLVPELDKITKRYELLKTERETIILILNSLPQTKEIELAEKKIRDIMNNETSIISDLTKKIDDLDRYNDLLNSYKL